MANLIIEDVEGIGPSFGEKLRNAGIADIDTLLERGSIRKGREKLADAH